MGTDCLGSCDAHGGRRTDYFARGELTRLVFEAFRENGTTAARRKADQ
jgi:hypothetical protein